MLLKEIFYKRKNEKAWSLRLLTLVFLSCFVLSIQSFAVMEGSPSFTVKQLRGLTEGETELVKAIIASGDNVTIPAPGTEGKTELVKAIIANGDNVTIPAPGEYIKTTGLLNNTYKTVTGTGYAAAHVSAAIAIAKFIMERSPFFTVKQLRGLVESGNQPMLKYLATNVLMTPDSGAFHWEAYPEYYDLMKTLIARASDETLLYIAQKLSFNPHTEGETELVKAIILNGDNVTIPAPGEDIKTTGLNNTYQTVTGTDYANARVIAAIAIAKFKKKSNAKVFSSNRP